MTTTIYDPILPLVSAERRLEMQEALGRHLVEARNRMAEVVKQWIDGDRHYPIPIYDRILDRVRQLEPSLRADVKSVALLMADEIVSAVLSVFDGGDDAFITGLACNYAIVAQLRNPDSDNVIEQIDVNRGEPVLAIWNNYKKWLSRYAPTELRPRSSSAAT
jgi:hypothetical protein